MHARQADRREAPAALQQPLTASAQQQPQQQHQQQQRHSHDPTASPATAASSAPAQLSGLPDALPPAPHSYHYHHQHLAQLPAGGPAAAFASGPSVVYQHVWLGPTEAPPSAPFPPPGGPSAVQLLPHHYHLHQQHVHSHPYHHHHYHVHDPYLQHYRQQHPYHAYHLLVQQPHVHLHQHALRGFSPHLGTPAPSAASPATPAGPTAQVPNNTSVQDPTSTKTAASSQPIRIKVDPAASAPAPPPGRCDRQLIVNYLDNEASGPELMRIFGTVGTVESARVMYDAKSNEPLGYGFVYMETAEDASRAVTLLNRYPLRKKRLKVSFANPKRDNAPAPRTKPRPLTGRNDDDARPTPDPSSSGPTSGGPSGSSGNGSGGSDASSTS